MLKKNEFALFHLWQYPGFEPDRERQADHALRLSTKEPPQLKGETLNMIMQAVKENFRDTQGLFYSLTYIFVITLFLFPGTTNDSYFNFISNSNIKDKESWY